MPIIGWKETMNRMKEEIATLTRRNGILQQQFDDMVKSKQEMSKISEQRRDVIMSITNGMNIDELRKKLPSIDIEGLFALRLLNK